jgi:hypothetical protein
VITLDRKYLALVSLYRGHILAVVAAILVIIASILTIMLMADAFPADDMVWVIILTSVAWQGAIILGPVSYMLWVPKWEREEKITGRFPGDKEKE